VKCTTGPKTGLHLGPEQRGEELAIEKKKNLRKLDKRVSTDIGLLDERSGDVSSGKAVW